jgi:hypothetical protein
MFGCVHSNTDAVSVEGFIQLIFKEVRTNEPGKE